MSSFLSAVSALRAAAEPTRLRLLALLARAELTVGEICEILGQSQPRVSRHLKLMCDAGLLDRFREQLWVYYRAPASGEARDTVWQLLALVDEDDDVLRRDRRRMEEVIAERGRRAADHLAEEDAPSDVVDSTIVEHTAGGAHVSMDALGSRVTCYNSIACLRPQGRHVQVGLMLGAHADPPVPMGLVIAKELQVMGSHGMQAHRYGAMLDLNLTGRVQPQRLVEKTIALTAAPAELAAMDSFRGTGITVINVFQH